ncbi:MAG: glutamine--tRNA ligase/YqeY domain fusion protein [Deltaproteobacteria bacterium]|nr:glutamine--tRNA ligase/YqeY domain fusion protein [Deltaproteobacteria bacterium]
MTAKKTPETQSKSNAAENASKTPPNFIRNIIEEDNRTGKFDHRVSTRFPPEPNGYLHIGHAKSICLNFGIAAEFGGTCNLRFDDTNPLKENVAYVEAIKTDVLWLGYDWQERLYFASDYFEQLYQYAVALIKQGKAYVCSLNDSQMRAYRGTLTEPGKDSPYRNRSVQENLDLFEKMRAGEFEDGTHVLRAKIDMSSGNLNMRDPVIYRIRRATHHRTGDAWCIYPLYDFTHCLSDSIEGITHSLCSLEFEDHRPLYDWVLDNLPVTTHPQQIEFSRLNLSYTILSKRKLIQVVQSGAVNGWDDPRLPTISGLRRRGYSSAAIRNFCDRIGVAKRDSMVDVALLEHSVRENLNEHSPRVLAVLRPLKVVIVNYPEDQTEELEGPFHPDKPEMGARKLPFSRELYIDRDDFLEDPPKKFFRLAPRREVRLRYAYYVTCVDVIKDETTGEIREIHCTYDPETRGGWSKDGRKVKGTMHWVSTAHAVDAQVRLYDRLFTIENPGGGGANLMDGLNPNSLEILTGCKLEPSLADVAPGHRCQFERLGYFCADEKDSAPGGLVFNRTVTLRDAWAKIAKRQKKSTI